MWLISQLALASPCSAPLAREDFFVRLEAAQSEGEARSLLACLNSPLDPAEAEKVRQRMLLLAPPGEAKAATVPLSPAEGWVQVNGRYQQLSPDEASILQWIGEQGEVLATRYWRPGEPLGELGGTPPKPGWHVRAEAGAGAAGSAGQAWGGSLRLGFGVEGGGRWALTARTGYQAFWGEAEASPATLQGGWALVGLHYAASSLGISLGPTWNLAWGRWQQGELAQGLSWGPGGRAELEWKLRRNWLIVGGGGGWSDGERIFWESSLGVAIHIR